MQEDIKCANQKSMKKHTNEAKRGRIGGKQNHVTSAISRHWLKK